MKDLKDILDKNPEITFQEIENRYPELSEEVIKYIYGEKIDDIIYEKKER